MTFFTMCLIEILYVVETILALVLFIGVPLVGLKAVYDGFMKHKQEKAAAQLAHEQHLQRMEDALYKKEFFKEIA